MIYQAYELLAMLRGLTLVGKSDGELEWIGTASQWKWVECEKESILRDYELNKI